MILVTGATGKSGREIVKQLSAANAPVRALVRDAGKAGDLAALPHVEIFEGDLRESDTLDAALEGVERALYWARASAPCGTAAMSERHTIATAKDLTRDDIKTTPYNC